MICVIWRADFIAKEIVPNEAASPSRSRSIANCGTAPETPVCCAC